ncbi:ATP-dependent DNA ligase [Candidatus Dependentiae bacterium]
MKFSYLSQVFDEIEKISGRLEITKLLAGLLKKATPKEAKIICYLSLGKLKPPYIGTQFQIAEKNFVKVVAHLLNMDEPEVKKLAKEYGDVGSVLEHGRWRTKEDLTVSQVYKELEIIENISGIGAQEGKINALYELLKKLDPISAKYIARIVIGKLRLGFSDMTVIDALSWMEVGDKSLRKKIENAYNICADIGLIAYTLKEGGIEAIEDMHIKVGVPIRPSAAERMPTAKAIVEKIGDCIAQPKLDGFRLQIHLDKTGPEPIVRFFSRNLIDMSYMFPDIAQAVKELDVQELICEGEAIVQDPNTGNFLPFQETVKRKRKHGIEQMASELPLKVFLFDLLYLNGQEFLNKTHRNRRKALIDLLKNYKGDRIEVIQEKKIETAKELEHYFAENIASGLEGLVVKKPDSHYQPGKRNFNWIKLKRQEDIGGLEDTIDCVILGYYAGKGKRAHFGIGAFLVGVYNKKEDIFQTIAKVGTGVKDLEWVELKNRCDKIAVKDRPKNVQCPKELAPDVWVSPEIVCLIRADDISRSPLHAAGRTSHELGFALRFPRFMGYRPDKSPTEATTVVEIKRLYEDQFI